MESFRRYETRNLSSKRASTRYQIKIGFPMFSKLFGNHQGIQWISVNGDFKFLINK